MYIYDWWVTENFPCLLDEMILKKNIKLCVKNVKIVTRPN